eukprot:TRINITY_DN8434_c0_g1_i3.p1 TRINITY_DN8434_c0_g1~~TRINITY_DN8434_c0_g1_i3.p1  ORF type:complete len:264 (-),score=64.06 TRINITY_DN8434_c0_g1_i3:156-947(-)
METAKKDYRRMRNRNEAKRCREKKKLYVLSLEEQVKELERKLEEKECSITSKRSMPINWLANEIEALKKVCEDSTKVMVAAVEMLSEQKSQYLEKIEHTEIFERKQLNLRTQTILKLPEDPLHMQHYSESLFKPNIFDTTRQANELLVTPRLTEQEKEFANTQNKLKQYADSLKRDFASVQSAVSGFTKEIQRLREYLSEKYILWSDVNPVVEGERENQMSFCKSFVEESIGEEPHDNSKGLSSPLVFTKDLDEAYESSNCLH